MERYRDSADWCNSIDITRIGRWGL